MHVVETLDVAPGDLLKLTFESAAPRWRQGVWLGVHGSIRIGDESGSRLVLWHDTAPATVVVEVLGTDDGSIRLYNVWDSGRGRKLESQSATSGMLREETEGGSGWRYRCNDIGFDPAFDGLVFTVDRI